MSVRMAICMRHLQVCFSMWCLVCVRGMSSVLTTNLLVQVSQSASERKVRANCRAPCDDTRDPFVPRLQWRQVVMLYRISGR